ncbi:porin, partial [Acinetobacter baumannii]
TNEVISATTGNVFTNPAGKYDPAGAVVGNTAGDYHNTYSLSADYRINAQTTVGAGGGYVKDSSRYNNNARQFSLIVNYDLSKRTRLYAVAS